MKSFELSDAITMLNTIAEVTVHYGQHVLIVLL